MDLNEKTKKNFSADFLNFEVSPSPPRLKINPRGCLRLLLRLASSWPIIYTWGIQPLETPANTR